MEGALNYYQQRDADGSGMSRLLGESLPMRSLKQKINQLLEAEQSLTDGPPTSVLICGETGTGKELVARALHFNGTRREKPFVTLNCGAIPTNLLEADLFGYEKGAFTDARERKPGLAETADGGTLFLDEIGDMELSSQVKLLKLLEDRVVRRLGGTRELAVDVQIISATNQPLEIAVQDGQFRSDLYFRLRVLQLELPPLRSRNKDILLLAENFLVISVSVTTKAICTSAPLPRRRCFRTLGPAMFESCAVASKTLCYWLKLRLSKPPIWPLHRKFHI